MSTAQTGVFLYIEPLVAVVVAFFILSEPITLASLIGGGVIILGVWPVNREGEEMTEKRCHSSAAREMRRFHRN